MVRVRLLLARWAYFWACLAGLSTLAAASFQSAPHSRLGMQGEKALRCLSLSSARGAPRTLVRLKEGTSAVVEDISGAVDRAMHASTGAEKQQWELCVDTELPEGTTEALGVNSMLAPLSTNSPGTHDVGADTAVIVVVDYLIDDSTNVSACQTNSGYCNLRSAVASCSLALVSVDVECIVVLPPSQLLLMDPTLGNIALSDRNGTLSILGNECRATMLSDQAATAGFLRLESSHPRNVLSLNIYNLTIDAFGGDDIDGGALFISGLASVTLKHTGMSNNTGRDGAGIYMSECSNVRIFGTRFENNTAAAGNGGALYAHHNSNNLTIWNSTFSRNYAENGGSIYLNEENFDASLHGCSFLENSAGVSGGSLYLNSRNYDMSISRCVFKNSSVLSSFGGAVFVNTQNHFLLISDSSFVNSFAGDYGGSLHFNVENVGVAVGNCRFANDYAVVGGGSIGSNQQNTDMILYSNTFQDCFSGEDGGAVRFTTHNYRVIVTDCNFWDTVSGEKGGALALVFSNVNVSVVNCAFSNTKAGVGGGAIFSYTLNSKLSIENCVFSGTSAASSVGGAVVLGSANDRSFISNNSFTDVSSGGGGGAVAVATDNVHVTIVQNVFLRCCSDGDDGGAIHVDAHNNDLVISYNYFVEATAKYDGGSIGVIERNANILILRNNFINSSATFRGGALIVDTLNDHVVIKENLFRGCSAEYGGSTLVDYMNNYLALLENVFEKSSARREGGALYLYTDNYETFLSESTFITCSALSDGGDIYSHSRNDFMVINSCSFTDSYSATRGGSIFLEESVDYMAILDCTFYGSSAEGNGGALYLQAENQYLEVIRSVFNLTSALKGGAIFAESLNKQVVASDSLFIDNLSSLGGGSLYLYNANYLATIINCEFRRSFTSQNGGAVYIASDNLGCDITSSVFAYCAGLEGGALYLGSSNFRLLISDVSFSNNVAADSGGAVLLQDSNDEALFLGCNFDQNAAGQYGGGVAVESTNTLLAIEGSVFRANRAKLGGGGVQSSLANSDIVISSCHFESNIAPFGGGVYFGDYHETMTIRNSTFWNNSGSYGGGVYVTQFNNGLVFDAILFNGNSVSENGGGLYVLADDLMLSRSELLNNSALSAGGAYLRVEELVVYDCHVDHNHARTSLAGGILLDSATDVSLNLTTFTYNRAVSGGAVGILDCTSVSVENCVFTENVGSYFDGGAMYVYSSMIDISDATFDGNIANNNGGAVHLYQSSDSVLHDSVYAANSAGIGSGSALWMTESDRISIQRNSFSGNSAALGGGTVYWDASNMVEPQNVSTDNYYSGSNVAMYGRNVATNAYLLKLQQSSFYEVSDYAAPVPPISSVVVDFYGQTLHSESSAIVVAQVLTTAQCFKSSGYVTGGFIEQFQGGAVNFTDLLAYCDPGYTMAVNLTSNVAGVFLASSFLLSFRDCVRGEYFSDSICLPCEEGSYSLTDPATTSLDLLSQKICKECPDGALRCHGDTIYLKNDHWRISDLSTNIFTCPHHSSCVGGAGAGNDLCAEGYEGPLCAICSAGYAFRSTTGECEPCSETSSLDAVTIILFCLFGLVVMVICLFYYCSGIRRTVKSMDDFYVFMLYKLRLLNASASGMGDTSLRNSARAIVKRFKARMKIYVTLWQIISILPFTLNLNFPNIYSAIAAALSVFNLNISTSSLVTCAVDNSYDAIDSLVVDTSYPVVVVGVLWVLFRAHLWMKAGENSSALAARYFNIFLLFTYLILPFTTAKIFQIFSCQNVDPDNVVEGDDHYMTIDYSVSCSSMKYNFGFVWAIVCIFVYPVGIPALYFYVLHASKRDIISRNVKSTPEEEAQRDARLHPIRLLFEFYEPHLWFWEIVETFNRLFLTGVLVVISQGSAVQIIIGVAVSLLFVKITDIYRPYADRKIQTLREICQWQIFSVFFIAILLKADFGSVERVALDVFLVLVVMANLALDVLQAIWSRLDRSIVGDQTIAVSAQQDFELPIFKQPAVNSGDPQFAATTTSEHSRTVEFDVSGRATEPAGGERGSVAVASSRSSEAPDNSSPSPLHQGKVM